MGSGSTDVNDNLLKHEEATTQPRHALDGKSLPESVVGYRRPSPGTQPDYLHSPYVAVDQTAPHAY